MQFGDCSLASAKSHYLLLCVYLIFWNRLKKNHSKPNLVNLIEPFTSDIKKKEIKMTGYFIKCIKKKKS